MAGNLREVGKPGGGALAEKDWSQALPPQRQGEKLEVSKCGRQHQVTSGISFFRYDLQFSTIISEDHIDLCAIIQLGSAISPVPTEPEIALPDC